MMPTPNWAIRQNQSPVTSKAWGLPSIGKTSALFSPQYTVNNNNHKKRNITTGSKTLYTLLCRLLMGGIVGMDAHEEHIYMQASVLNMYCFLSFVPDLTSTYK